MADIRGRGRRRRALGVTDRDDIDLQIVKEERKVKVSSDDYSFFFAVYDPFLYSQAHIYISAL